MAYVIGYFALLVALMYFFVVRPRRRQVLAYQALMSELQIGDEIISAGGIYGTIRALRDEFVELEIADGIVVKLARGAIARPVPPPAVTSDGEAA